MAARLDSFIHSFICFFNNATQHIYTQQQITVEIPRHNTTDCISWSIPISVFISGALLRLRIALSELSPVVERQRGGRRRHLDCGDSDVVDWMRLGHALLSTVIGIRRASGTCRRWRRPRLTAADAIYGCSNRQSLALDGWRSRVESRFSRANARAV